VTKALVVIDVQKAMWEADQPYDGDGTVERIAALIARARDAGAPLFFVQHDGGPENSFQRGKPGFDFHDRIAPRPGEDVTVKIFGSAFHCTDLDAKLQRAGVDRLIVTGMQSEYCVDSAVRGAVERGTKSSSSPTATRPSTARS
jgi:nicotinamidase-related amidase